MQICFHAFKTISKDNYVLSRFTGNGCSFPVLEDNAIKGKYVFLK